MVFGPKQSVMTTPGSTRSVFAADIDGDGDQDVTAAQDLLFLVGDVVWYRNTDGMGTFGPEKVITQMVLVPRSVFAADLQGDGDLDVLSASSDDGKVAWYENTNGNGIFGSQQVITYEARGAYSVFAADLDGSGYPDVLYASSAGNKIGWHANLFVALSADVGTIPLSTGGTQTLALDAGSHRSFLPYLLLGSTSGTDPALLLDVHALALNPDNYTGFTLLAPNTPPLGNSSGFLDAQGESTASFTLPPGSLSVLNGLTVHHAFLVIEVLPTSYQVGFTSNAVPLELVP